MPERKSAARPDDLAQIASRLELGDEARAATISKGALQMATDAGKLTIAASLRRIISKPAPLPKPAAETQPPPTARDDSDFEKDAPGDMDNDEPIYIANAGLVLFSPFLPTLFERLHVLSDGADNKQIIKGVDALSRAVHMLQYIVDGRLDAPEHELVLCKLLCGTSPSTPISKQYEASSNDLEICHGLIAAVIENWTSISGTSFAGLQETFLQREGRLTEDDDQWQLLVQRSGVDVLVDKIPWTFGIIAHRWIAKPVVVTW